MIEQLLTGAGAIAVVSALSAWLGKVWANRILQQDRVRYETQMQTLLHDLRTRGEKEVFVHRLQFEKEFQIYLDLWKEVLALARAASQFRCLKLDSGKSHEEELRELMEAHNRLNHQVYDHRPFYAPEIYDLTKQLVKKARKVADFQTILRAPEGLTDRTEKVLDEITELIDPICDAIRRRIWATEYAEAQDQTTSHELPEGPAVTKRVQEEPRSKAGGA